MPKGEFTLPPSDWAHLGRTRRILTEGGELRLLALADRDVYYGDPLFVEVPLPELLSDGYTEMRRKLIDPQHAALAQRPGDPRGPKALLEEKKTHYGLRGPTKDTTACVVADRWGNVVAIEMTGELGGRHFNLILDRSAAGGGNFMGRAERYSTRISERAKFRNHFLLAGMMNQGA